MLVALCLHVIASLAAPAGEAEVAHVSHVAGETGDFVRATHVRLQGSSFEIGRELARLARERHGSAAVPAADPEAVRAQRAYFAARNPAHLERMRGAAEVFGVALDDDAFALDSIGYATPFAGCTVVYYPPETTTDGRGVLARNFDFTTGTFDGRTPKQGDAFACAEPYVLELHPTDAYASIALVAFDLFGVVDGINSEGLVIALLADDEASRRYDLDAADGPQAGFGVVQVGRHILETCANVDEAKAALLEAKLYYTSIPCHYLIADRHGRAFVWENSVFMTQGYVIEDPGCR
jgi:predicted choloylglycine hydrolase